MRFQRFSGALTASGARSSRIVAQTRKWGRRMLATHRSSRGSQDVAAPPRRHREGRWWSAYLRGMLGQGLALDLLGRRSLVIAAALPLGLLGATVLTGRLPAVPAPLTVPALVLTGVALALAVLEAFGRDHPTGEREHLRVLGLTRTGEAGMLALEALPAALSGAACTAAVLDGALSAPARALAAVSVLLLVPAAAIWLAVPLAAAGSLPRGFPGPGALPAARLRCPTGRTGALAFAYATGSSPLRLWGGTAVITFCGAALVRAGAGPAPAVWLTGCWLAAGVALELCRVEEGPGWARVAAVGQVGRADRLRARTVVATGILAACLLVLTLLALGAAQRPSGSQALAAGAAALYVAVLQVAVEAVVVRLTGTRRLLAAEEILLALLAFVPVVPLVGLIVPALPSWRPDRRARRA